MTNLIISFLNWYFMTILPMIPEQFIDLFAFVSIFGGCLVFSIICCILGWMLACVGHGIYKRCCYSKH